MKTETPNMKTVTPSSKWSSASSCTSLLRENKIPSQVNKSRKLKPILWLAKGHDWNYQFHCQRFIYLVDVCGLQANKKMNNSHGTGKKGTRNNSIYCKKNYLI